MDTPPARSKNWARRLRDSAQPQYWAHAIRELRKTHGLTQHDLADVLGVTETAISNWEHAKNRPSVDQFDRIAAYFGASYQELLGRAPMATRTDFTIRSSEGTPVVIGQLKGAFSPKEERQVIARLAKVLELYAKLSPESQGIVEALLVRLAEMEMPTMGGVPSPVEPFDRAAIRNAFKWLSTGETVPPTTGFLFSTPWATPKETREVREFLTHTPPDEPEGKPEEEPSKPR